MDVKPVIEYYESGKKQQEFWRVNGISHRVDGPCYIEYYESGEIERESWYLNGSLHRIDGPAYIEYNNTAVRIKEKYYIDGVLLEGEKLEKYKNWVQNNNLVGREWTDEGKVLWRLSWL